MKQQKAEKTVPICQMAQLPPFNMHAHIRWIKKIIEGHDTDFFLKKNAVFQRNIKVQFINQHKSFPIDFCYFPICIVQRGKR